MKQKLTLLAVVALLCPRLLLAQSTCELQETIDACFTRILQGIQPSEAELVKTEKAEASTEAVAESQPGAESSGTQVRSTVTDLIPLLSALGLLSESDTSDGAVTLDLNFLIPVAEADRNSQLTAQINLKPQPYEPLVQTFPEAVRDERKSQLEERIEDTGDLKLQFTWSLVTERLGRDFRRQSQVIDALLTPLIHESRGPRNRAARRAHLDTMDELITKLQKERAAAGLSTTLDDVGAITFGELTPGVREQMLKSVEQAAAATGAYQKALSEHLDRRLTESGVDQVAKLVLQQPQLLFSASKEVRDELVGPEAWSLKVTYEHSFANLGNFLRKHGRSDCPLDQLSADAAVAERCYTALSQYLADHAAELEHEDRWALSAEYRRFDAVTYDFPADGVSLAVPKHDRLIVGLGYGRALPGSKASDRVDFHVDYDSAIDDEPGGQSRFVASFTYTRRIGEVDIPFGIVYANKSEFLEGVDKTVSLHVGVKFSPPD